MRTRYIHVNYTEFLCESCEHSEVDKETLPCKRCYVTGYVARYVELE